MRLTLPDGSGWFDLLHVEHLNATHQDEYWDLRDELIEKRRAELPAPGPDPANPAQTLPAPAVRLRRADIRQLEDLVASWVVQDTSFAGVLPWGPASRAAMPLPAWNALRSELEKDGGHFDAVNGVAPKAPTSPAPTGTTGSADTSAAGTPSPLPEPAGEPSGTPQG